MANTARASYPGRSRKLVIALDIGTAFSGGAYALLDPGEIPQIRSVTKYLNCPTAGPAKVTSVLHYNRRSGDFRGVENGVDFQDDDKILRMRWWKLMMSPSATMRDQMSQQLPRGKSLIDVFADLIRFLFDSTKEFFKISELNGGELWESVSDNIELVLTHPNGWGDLEQKQMHTAAVRAGVVPESPSGRSRVHFVTEGEVNFIFCATYTEAGKHLRPGEEVLIIDAGGGTIDISTYTVLNNNPLQVEELYEPKCLLQGAEFVTARAREMVQELWRNSKFDTPEDLEVFSRMFDEGVKRTFSSDHTSQFVKFCRPRDNDPLCGIRAGKLRLTGTQVSGFFEPSIQSTVASIKDNFSQRLAPGSIVFLVGGFAASAWLSKELENRLSSLGLKICKPDAYTNKVVAIGAVLFYVDHFVTGRISESTYSTPVSKLGIQRQVNEMNERLENGVLSGRERIELFNKLCKTCSRHHVVPTSMLIPDCSGDSVKVASGGFADVSQGKYKGLRVAIKVLRVYTDTLDLIRDRFYQEGVAWKHLNHPNILPLLGVTINEHRFALISEWMDNGNINEFIKGDQNINRPKLLADAASGLKYMHDLHVVHGDLKGANILINKDRRACLADFGLSTITSVATYDEATLAMQSANNSLMSFTAGGTYWWMSPELMYPERFGVPKSENQRPTRQSDCYALGMVIYEVLCGHQPYLELKLDHLALVKIIEGVRPEKPSRAAHLGFNDELWRTVELCWLGDRNARPVVEYVLANLNYTAALWHSRES